MRRFTGRMKGERYLANASTTQREVHDLDNENANCQIELITRAGHERPYVSLPAAHAAGYDNCHWCVGQSRR